MCVYMHHDKRSQFDNSGSLCAFSSGLSQEVTGGNHLFIGR